MDYDADKDAVVTQTGPDAPVIAGWVVLADANAPIDDPGGVSGNPGMGGQGLLPVPNVYNGWVQKLPSGEGADSFYGQLTVAQRSPFAGTVITPCTPKRFVQTAGIILVPNIAA